ncbi:MAG TPA: hypothetical protein VK969_00365, partial [Acidimicrobiia bacterium]|nr:hypothetical protein [Acidimicrobiia bacterium]
VVALILFSLVAMAPVPDGWRERLDESRVVQLIAGDDAVPRRLFESLAGDNAMSAIASLQRLFDSPRAVPEGDEVLEIPPAAADEVRQARDEVPDLIERLNEDRVGAGLRAAQTIEVLTRLAESHAESLYTTGRLERIPDCVAALAERSYQVLHCDNGVALAGTSIAAYSGIYESASGRAVIDDPDFDRVGASVVDGPTGRLVVLVLAG